MTRDPSGASDHERRRRVSIRDVAREAGVSMTTVSHALNGIGRVDAGTRRRVADVAGRLGYRANPSARNLRRGRTGILALTNRVPPGGSEGLTDLEYFVDVVMAATAAALSRHYSLILAPPADDPLALDGLPIDGAIVIDPLRDDPLLRRLDELGVPAVTIGRDPAWGEDEGWAVDNDIPACTRRALDHLAGAGAERVALLTGPALQSYTVDACDAYAAWTRERGAEPRVAQAASALGEGAGYRAALSLLNHPERPDAILAVVERLALRALQAAAARDLRVPEDLRIAAGSDSVAARNATPAITALDLHPEELGRHAVELLIARVEGDEPRSRRRLIPGRVVVRGSTARRSRAHV